MAPGKHFDPAKHKHKGKGQKGGGQFTNKSGSSSDTETETTKIEWEGVNEGRDSEAAYFKNKDIEISISKADGENGDFIIGYAHPKDTAGVDIRYAPDEFTTMNAAKAYAQENIDDFIAKLQKKPKQKRATGTKLPYYD
jgi:hypothetical protein